MFFKAQMTFEDSLAHLGALDADDFHGVWDLQDLWASLIKEDLNLLTRMYRLYFGTVRRLLGQTAEADSLEGLDAYKFILAFSSARYLATGGHLKSSAGPEAWRLLQERHQEHLDLIEKALARPDERITEKHTRIHTGTWGDIAGAMLEVYFWHTPYGEESDQIKAEIAAFIPTFYRTFPSQRNSTLSRMLMHHPEAVREAAALIRFYVLQRGKVDDGLIPLLAIDMLGHHADKRHAAHAKCSEILAKALNDAADWPEDTLKAFIEHLILYPLGIETYTQEEAAARQRKKIENQRRIISEGHYKSEMGRSAQSQKERDEEYLKDYEAELALIENDFAEWNARRRRKAVQRIAVSAATRKALKAVLGKLPAAHRQGIRSLLDEAVDYASRPKRFPMPKPSDNRFKDFGLKLLVIEELMYRQKVLEPRFDIYEFTKEYEKREISVETDGYAVIPEVERYFRNLAISDDLLARVETLHQSSGLDGGSEFLNHMFPFWDPGMGDEPIAVTNKAVADLALLPNLKRITGLENSRPGPKLLKALAGRGIELIDEENAGR